MGWSEDRTLGERHNSTMAFAMQMRFPYITMLTLNLRTPMSSSSRTLPVISCLTNFVVNFVIKAFDMQPVDDIFDILFARVDTSRLLLEGKLVL